MINVCVVPLLYTDSSISTDSEENEENDKLPVLLLPVHMDKSTLDKGNQNITARNLRKLDTASDSGFESADCQLESIILIILP